MAEPAEARALLIAVSSHRLDEDLMQARLAQIERHDRDPVGNERGQQAVGLPRR